VQERAWASPIWYTPSEEARKASPHGMTVAALTKKGGTALDETQLKNLLVGKAVWMRNNVTGEQFKASYNEDGQSIVWHVGWDSTLPSYAGPVAETGYHGVTTPYTIANGKVITTFSQAPMEVAIYKLDDTYYAARSNEFGYANYQILPKAPVFLNPLGKGEEAGGEEDSHPSSAPAPLQKQLRPR
jgi:hypothetical protein